MRNNIHTASTAISQFSQSVCYDLNAGWTKNKNIQAFFFPFSYTWQQTTATSAECWVKKKKFYALRQIKIPFKALAWVKSDGLASQHVRVLWQTSRTKQNSYDSHLLNQRAYSNEWFFSLCCFGSISQIFIWNLSVCCNIGSHRLWQDFYRFTINWIGFYLIFNLYAILPFLLCKQKIHRRSCLRTVNTFADH